MYKNLREAMREANITVVMLARILEVSEKTISNKMSGSTDWTYPEANRIKALFPKYNSDWLFATDNKTT